MASFDDIRKNFKNTDLLDQALTHRSWINENPGVRGTNERLEFLGDAVLEFVVSDVIYNEFRDKEEGFLTSIRANLVNTINLSEVAIRINLGQEIFLSKGEDDGGGRKNTSLLADALEAVIGAIYLDQGLKEAESFIRNNILNDLSEMVLKPLKDSKSKLQEAVQAMGFSTPKYKVIQEFGPDHAKTFVVEVVINDKVWGKGEGKSKNEAEQEAAKQALLVKTPQNK